MNNFDFFDLDMFSRGTPHALLHRFRREHPISWHGIPDTPASNGFWLLVRHKDICEVARQPRIFLSHAGSVLSDSVEIPHPAWKMVRDGLCHLDAPLHGQLRRMINPLFGAESMICLEATIRKRAGEVLDRAMQRSGFDLVAEIATRFPVQVVYGDVLGFADDDLASAAYWGDLFNRVHAIPPRDREFADTMRASGIALDKLYRHGVDVYESRRKAPREDVLSALANMQFEGDISCSQDVFLSYFWSLAIGAYDTTASTIASGIAALAAHPEQEEALYADPALIETAVEEMLRWESPVIYFRRTAAEDYELQGQLIRKGQRVVMCFAAGNRDEEVFDWPDKFMVDRKHNPHLSFGHGAHFCLGARLARLELRVLFEEIVARQIKFRPVAPVTRARSNFINRITRMPVRLETDQQLVTMSF